MKEFKNETVIISKDCWKFLYNYNRAKKGLPNANDEWLDKIWKRAFRNGGANPITHPIKDDEIRIDKYCFSINWTDVKSIVTKNGYSYRKDDFIIEGFNI